MTAILIGDIIDSSKTISAEWMISLKEVLLEYGQSPTDWEIYRGDEFQLSVSAEDALVAVYKLKAVMKSLKMDVRISIGLGDVTYEANKITERNGTAFIRSGQLFENLKQKKLSLAIDAGNENFNTTMNILFRFAISVMDGWLPQSAQYVIEKLKHPDLSQIELGTRLGITQAAVSRRHTRSQIDLLLDLERLYSIEIKKLA